MQNKCLIFWINYIFNVTLHLEMKYNTYTLDNGLRIIHLPSDSQVVYCGYQINAGTATRNRARRAWLTSASTSPSRAPNAARRGTYSTVWRVWAATECLHQQGGHGVLLRHPEGAHRKAVDLLSDIVFHSVYPQAEIDKEVEVICDEIESYNDSPAELIYDEFENILFKGSPLGHNILAQPSRFGLSRRRMRCTSQGNFTGR